MAELIDAKLKEKVQLESELGTTRAQIDHLTLSLSKMMGERNLFKAEAHAKKVEHELVSRRYLEIREESDNVKFENERLRNALKNLGQDIDDIMV
jgi:chromosome segregation ATPase